MDKLDAMRSFIAVIDTGSFAKAARRLRCSPTAVTRAVAQLEKELGLGLLTRTTRSVRSTERGGIYAECCRRLLADLENSERLTRGVGAAPRGELRIAAPVMFGRLHVMPMVEALLASHPDLSVRVMLSDRVAHLVEEGIDVAVRLADLTDSNLIAVRVASVHSLLVASPKYLDEHGRPRSMADLGKHQIIEFEGLGSSNEWRFGSQGRLAVRTHPRLSVNCASSAVSAAERGCGITRAISYQVQTALDAGTLEIVLPRIAENRIPVNLVYPENRRGTANVTAFTEIARKSLQQAPGVSVASGPSAM